MANRQGARPTMTILERYYTRISTLTFVYTSERTLKVFSMLIYHSLQLLFFPRPFFFFCYPLLQPVASVSFFTHLEEFQHRALTALDLKSFLRFLITVRQGQNHCNVCHTHTCKYRKRNRESEGAGKRGGGGAIGQTLTHSWPIALILSLPLFFLPSILPILLSPSFLW